MRGLGTEIKVSSQLFQTGYVEDNFIEIEADKHAHQERARDREARERVVRRLGVRGGEGAGAREQRGRHERKKHREPVNHDGSPRKRAKRTRHGTDAKSPSLL